MCSQGDDLGVDVLGLFLDGFFEREERIFTTEDLIDAGAEIGPKFTGDVEGAAEVEHCALGDFLADAFGFHEPVGEIGLAGSRGVGFGLADEHDRPIRQSAIGSQLSERRLWHYKRILGSLWNL